MQAPDAVKRSKVLYTVARTIHRQWSLQHFYDGNTHVTCYWPLPLLRRLLTSGSTENSHSCALSPDATQWSSLSAVTSPLVVGVGEGQKQIAVEGVLKWLRPQRAYETHFSFNQNPAAASHWQQAVRHLTSSVRN